MIFSEPCQLEQLEAEEEPCNSWVYYPSHPGLWNHSNCPDPCPAPPCPPHSQCDSSLSTQHDPVLSCICK